MYRIVYFFIRLLSYLPFKVLYALSDVMYYVLYYVVRYRRAVVRRNLEESFPEMDEREIRKTEKRFYRFFMDMVLETCKLVTISEEEMRRRMKFVNLDEANQLLREGRSVSYFIGHYANWEWMSSVGLWLDEGAVCAQVYHKLQNAYMERIMKQMRQRMGNVCVEMHQTARYVSNRRAEGKPCMLALIADQSPKRREIKHYTEFLNHVVPVLVGPEKITKRYRYVPIFVGVRRVDRGYYVCELSRLHDRPEDLPEYQLTDLYFQRLEEEIRRQPECYLWTHKRFRYSQGLVVQRN